MEPINILTSKAVPLPLPNIDTDQIIPKQFLKRIERTGYGEFLFFDWRYDIQADSSGSKATPDIVKERPDFVLNKPHHKDAQILIAEKNFGCGSSREHAAWALQQYGFRAVIAPTFADIFFSNAGKNGMILVHLTEAEVQTLLERCTNEPNHRLTINLEAQTVTDELGFHATFEIDPFRKYCLIHGLDDIGLTLRHEKTLDHFEKRHDENFWSAPKAANV
jgi:3-isopropylmalate/(R)-2-methylmalate dehydratase small subunit